MASVQGIQAWARILALSAEDDPVRRAPTLFVPSDSAMHALPDGMVDELVRADGRALRRAFLARSATDARIELKDIAGKRILLATLDGRPLVIDATGGDIQVGDTEAIEIRALPDGRSLFILDHVITEGSVDPE
ncbi:MAG TPA: fasciclin domain-containing protein [Dongiaceae bacterium]|nr:fasciclin domain-containing protein [Dongiaceae bacterium]